MRSTDTFLLLSYLEISCARYQVCELCLFMHVCMHAVYHMRRAMTPSVGLSTAVVPPTCRGNPDEHVSERRFGDLPGSGTGAPAVRGECGSEAVQGWRSARRDFQKYVSRTKNKNKKSIGSSCISFNYLRSGCIVRLTLPSLLCVSEILPV